MRVSPAAWSCYVTVRWGSGMGGSFVLGGECVIKDLVFAETARRQFGSLSGEVGAVALTSARAAAQRQLERVTDRLTHCLGRRHCWLAMKVRTVMRSQLASAPLRAQSKSSCSSMKYRRPITDKRAAQVAANPASRLFGTAGRTWSLARPHGFRSPIASSRSSLWSCARLL